MTNQSFENELEPLWNKAVGLYKSGNRDAESYFSNDEKLFLSSIGVTAREVYDFAEDFTQSGEPDFKTFALVHEVRRSYFDEVQKGKLSSQTVAPSTFPAKTDEVRGIVWLPRIIEKAKVKLHGELDPDTMYGCGGDRRFFRENNVDPAEFLRIVWKNETNNEPIVSWVEGQRKTKST